MGQASEAVTSASGSSARNRATSASWGIRPGSSRTGGRARQRGAQTPRRGGCDRACRQRGRGGGGPVPPPALGGEVKQALQVLTQRRDADSGRIQARAGGGLVEHRPDREVGEIRPAGLDRFSFAGLGLQRAELSW